ncbi:NAD(P)/FAD-dependent oxidoreductase [Aquincola sp. MAHUQ-54]|uniref:Ferredoxin--NADP reductase n=1 Tax=Aquincola agrisoli TaxID=3119538 RepID=A0AAW9QPT3_9BURK
MIETDALIVGAGPVGLFQVFELGLLEIGAHVVDSLPQPGGQCIELYPDKPIYDIPGLLATSGRELVARLLQQIAPFKAPLHLDQEVSLVQRQPDGRFRVETRRGLQFMAKTVFIAGGVGAFQPKPLRVDGLAAFEGSQLHYRVQDPARFAGRHIVVVGGGDSALDWANHLADPASPHRAASVTLLHRRDAFQALPAGVARMRALCEAGQMQFATGQVAGIEVQQGRLVAAKVLGGDGVTRVVPLDDLLVFFGLSPRLGPIADWGLAIERKQLVVDTEKFETSEPGIFAVGDINTYPGKKKLILCGFHEATLAAFGALRHVHPDKPGHLQYTTTSPRLHELLGVETPLHDDGGT